ncbi:hypothetical protein KY284_016468 [Solanum tuberosum]|nr:hypothetical protein KY284_016468 [Solanum tuberosum]
MQKNIVTKASPNVPFAKSLAILRRIAGTSNGSKQFFCEKREEEREENLLFAYQSDASVKNNEWYVDSGCSNHMTGDEKAFRSINSSITTKERMGNGALVDAKGKGTISINIKESDVSNQEEDEEEEGVYQGGEILDSDDEEPPPRGKKMLSDIYQRFNFTGVKKQNYEEAIKHDVWKKALAESLNWIYKTKLNQEGDTQKHKRKAKFICYCQMGEQLTDIFTKTLPKEKFWYLREGIGVVKKMH